MNAAPHVVAPDDALTLDGLFRERVRRTPDAPAYRFFDAHIGAWTDCSWSTMASEVNRWRRGLAAEGLKAGDRVAIMARNSRLWVAFDQAALSLGLVVVPLYADDRADNVAYVLHDAGAKVLVIGGTAEWQRLAGGTGKLRVLRRIVSIADVEDRSDPRLRPLHQWLHTGRDGTGTAGRDPDQLATIVYTSGTTGHPKGVMLSHRNILDNAFACLQQIEVQPGQVFLSFLPLSHTLERTVGYYLPMMAGAVVAHARGIPELAQDLRVVRPHGLVSVPRIYERVHARVREHLGRQPAYRRKLFDLAVKAGWHHFEVRQGRARPGPIDLLWPLLRRMVADPFCQRLGGNIQVAVSGGAALSVDVARMFIGLGVPLVQGYGLTEASPVISVNTISDNVPASIGRPLPGVEVRIGDNDELLARGSNVMLGFWHRPEDTRRVVDAQGWLHTGDKARIEDGRIFITGRIKEIVVLANGEKVSPADMELSILADPLFEQVMIVGEARPFLAALVVLDEVQWRRLAGEHGLDPSRKGDKQAEKLLLDRVARCVHEFPGYARVIRLRVLDEAWAVDNGLLTPTLKMKRPLIAARYAREIEQLYEHHGR